MRPAGSLCFALISLVLAVAQDSSDFYQPVERTIEGWTVKLDPLLTHEENRALADHALKAVANHLQRISYVVPPKQLEELRRLPIWIELNNPHLEHMQYHPNRRWLVDHGHDPALVKHVHIPRAANLTKRHMWAKHPYVLLHELAHAYHDQMLGFDHADIRRAFELARQQGSYEKVISHKGQQVRHYGLTNHKEYFAEATEAYLGVNDFYPFVRAELKQHDPTMFELLEQIWGPIE